MLAIDVSNLSKHFGSFKAVDGISLRIRKGEIFGLIGPNGAGKTTTIRILTGVLIPSEGNGTVGGFDIRNEQEEIKRIIGYMSQKFSLYDDLTVGENLNFFGGIYGLSHRELKKQVDRILSLTDISDDIGTVVKYLPQGYKQRLGLGCALLHKPNIVFLDEPTSGADPEFRLSFWELIRSMKNEGLSIIVTTHYLDEAERADRIALMNKGRIVEEGKPFDMVNNFELNTFEVRLQGKTLDTLKRTFTENIIQYGEKFHFLSLDTIDNVKEKLKSIGTEPVSIKKTKPKLEDIFTYRILSGQKGQGDD